MHNFTPRLIALHGTADRRVRALRKLGQPRRLGAPPRKIAALLLCGSLRLEQSVLLGALAWSSDLLAVPAAALCVALASSALPAWQAYAANVFAL